MITKRDSEIQTPIFFLQWNHNYKENGETIWKRDYEIQAAIFALYEE